MRSWSDERSESYVAINASSTEISLSPEDIPGAILAEPYTKRTAATLLWWLLCWGEAKRFPRVMLVSRSQTRVMLGGSLLKSPLEKWQQQTQVLSLMTSRMSNTFSHRALLSTSLGILWKVTLESFTLMLPQTTHVWPAIVSNTLTRWPFVASTSHKDWQTHRRF